jgi:hypothetical protein
MSPRPLPLRPLLAALSLAALVAALLAVARPAQAATTPAATPGSRPAYTVDANGVFHTRDGLVGHPRGTTGGVSAMGITAGTLAGQATGLCADDSPDLHLRHEICYAYSYTAGYQKWYFDWGNQNTIRNAYTNDCLDDSPDFHLRAIPCTSYAHYEGYQVWYTIAWSRGSDGAYIGNSFQNAFTGWCLDDSSVGLRTFPCNFQNFQLFM